MKNSTQMKNLVESFADRLEQVVNSYEIEDKVERNQIRSIRKRQRKN
jgi:hypothetical protein